MTAMSRQAIIDAKGRSSARGCLLVLLTVVLLGLVPSCGASKLVPVEGVVNLDGKPVEGATVVFLPDAAPGRPAQGLTASDGRFHLSTASERGAGRGDYKLVVTKTVGILRLGAEPPSPDDERKMMKQREDFARHSEKYLRSLLPVVYTSPATTPLRCKVPPDQPVLLNLTSTRSASSSSQDSR